MPDARRVDGLTVIGCTRSRECALPTFVFVDSNLGSCRSWRYSMLACTRRRRDRRALRTATSLQCCGAQLTDTSRYANFVAPGWTWDAWSPPGQCESEVSVSGTITSDSCSEWLPSTKSGTHVCRSRLGFGVEYQTRYFNVLSSSRDDEDVAYRPYKNPTRSPVNSTSFQPQSRS